MRWCIVFGLICSVLSQTVKIPGVTLDRLESRGYSAYTSMIRIDDNTLFLSTKGGDVLRYNINSDSLSRVTSMTVNSGSERGLLSLVTSGNNIFMYLIKSDGLPVILRGVFTSNSITGLREIWRGDRAGCGNHVGGRLVIDKSGDLLISIGDFCNPGWSQDLNEYYGKVLRMNLDGSPVTSNPWYGNGGKARFVYARGFRNPFRMYYQESSGKLYVNEVGQNTREAIYNVKAGDNYRWPNNDL